MTPTLNKMPVYLETNRLLLRNFRKEDLEALVDYRKHPDCSRYQRGQFKDRENLNRLIECTKTDDPFSEGKGRLAIARRDTREIVGDLFVSIEEKTISLGYTVSYRYHRRGYAFELLSALTDELHHRFPDKEIVCCVDRENAASVALLLKLGFAEEGYEKEIDALVFRLHTKA